MSPDAQVATYINPLAFTEVDHPWADGDTLPTALSVLDYLCAPGTASGVPDIVTRYRAVSQEGQRLFAVPMDERILQKLVWPLRYAKGSYALGNFLGTIALCGFVAEMVAIVLFEMAETSICGRPLGEKDQEDLYGSTFEKLGQERRVRILGAYGVIDVATRQAFSEIRDTRRRYLHLLSKDHDALSADAAMAFSLAVTLVVRAMGLQISESGQIAVSEAFLRYVDKGRSTESS